MFTYVFLYKLTDQGIKNIKSTPEDIKNAIAAWEGMGGKLLGVYCVQGEYDFVSIGEAPSEEVAVTFSLALSAEGDVRITSMRAFTTEEITEIINKLP